MSKDCILVLDIDGTLTHSIQMHQEALLGAMQKLNLEYLDTNWGSYPQHTDTGIFSHAMAENGIQTVSDEEAQRFEIDLDERFAWLLVNRGIDEVPGARALVQHATQSRWGVVFATGGIRAVSRKKLEAVGIEYEEKLLITSSEHRSRVDLVAAAVQIAKDHYDIPEPKYIVSVGDGLWDLTTAKKLDLGFVGVGKPGSASEVQLRANQAIVFGDLHQVFSYLGSLNIN